MSGDRVTFVGDAMAAVVQGVAEVRTLLGQPPVIVGGLAVLARLSIPYRATVDPDIVDRLSGNVPHLEVLRASDDAESVEPARPRAPLDPWSWWWRNHPRRPRPCRRAPDRSLNAGRGSSDET